MKTIALDQATYDELMAVTKWYDAMPTDLPNFYAGDRFHENVFEFRAGTIPDDALPEEQYLEYFELTEDGLCLVAGMEDGSDGDETYLIVRKD